MINTTQITEETLIKEFIKTNIKILFDKKNMPHNIDKAIHKLVNKEVVQTTILDILENKKLLETISKVFQTIAYKLSIFPKEDLKMVLIKMAETKQKPISIKQLETYDYNTLEHMVTKAEKEIIINNQQALNYLNSIIATTSFEDIKIGDKVKVHETIHKDRPIVTIKDITTQTILDRKTIEKKVYIDEHNNRYFEEDILLIKQQKKLNIKHKLYKKGNKDK